MKLAFTCRVCCEAQVHAQILGCSAPTCFNSPQQLRISSTGSACTESSKPASKHRNNSISMKIKKGIFRLKQPSDHNPLCWECAARREVKAKEGFAAEMLC